MSRTPVVVSWCLVAFLALTLTACGGGGGGSAPVSLTGSVTDSDRAPVVGATVSAYNSSGTRVATATTNSAGSYSLRGLGSGTFSLLASGPIGTFPTEVKNLSLTAGTVPTVDLYLPSTSAAVESSPGIYTLADPANGLAATLDLSAATVTGTPQVLLKPIDVSRFGIGEAAATSPLPLAVAAADRITPWYAAAAVELVGASISTAGLPATLQLPVAAAFQQGGLPSPATLYRLDPATLAWLAVDADPVTEGVQPVEATLDTTTAGAWFYAAAVREGGLYRVGGAPDAATTEITGAVTYEDGTTPVAGATVYLNGGSYGYQQLAITDAAGLFRGLALGSTYPVSVQTLTVTPCRKQGGLLICAPHEVDFAFSAAVVDLAHDPGITFPLPLTAAATTATLTIHDDTTLGIDVSSGRIYTDDYDIDNFADVTLTVSTFGTRSLQVGVLGAGALINNGSGPLTVTAPQTLTVRTAAGHRATLSLASVFDPGEVYMDVTLSVSFSL